MPQSILDQLPDQPPKSILSTLPDQPSDQPKSDKSFMDVASDATKDFMKNHPYGRQLLQRFWYGMDDETKAKYAKEGITPAPIGMETHIPGIETGAGWLANKLDPSNAYYGGSIIRGLGSILANPMPIPGKGAPESQLGSEQNLRTNPQMGQTFAGDSPNKVPFIEPSKPQLALPPSPVTANLPQTLETPSISETPSLGTGQPAELLKSNSGQPISEIPNQPLSNPTREVAKEALKTGQPEMISAAGNLVKNKSFIDKVKEANPFTSIEARFDQQGPVGQAIGMSVDRAALKSRSYGSQWLSSVRNSLDPEDFDKVVDTIEGANAPNADIQARADNISQTLQGIGQRLENSGISTKSLAGKEVPFKMADDYFPHSYPEGFWDQPDIVDKLVDSGMSRNEALQYLQMRRKFGEQLAPFQHQRIPDLEGYDKTPDVLVKYINNAARRLATAEELGPRDINGSPLKDMIESTPNPSDTLRWLKRSLPYRDDPSSYADQIGAKVGALGSRMESYLHLSRFALSKLNSSIPMMMRGNASDFVNEATKVLVNSGYARDLQNSTGVTHNIGSAVMDEINNNANPVGLYGMRGIDNYFRTVSAGMGKGLAQDLFDKVKSTPNDIGQLERLRNLVLEDPTKVITQKELTPEQLNMAGGRFAEMTQGLAEARKVPYGMSEPLLQLPLIFKKFAFQHGKIVKDAIMENPVRNIPLAVALSQVFGETVGDSKTALKAMGLSAYEGKPFMQVFNEEYGKRGDYYKRITGNHPIINHLMDNTAASWVPGIGTDLFQSLASPTGLLNLIGGTATEDVSKLLGNLGQQNFKGIGREAIGDIPLVGSAELGHQVIPPGNQQSFRINPNLRP